LKNAVKKGQTVTSIIATIINDNKMIHYDNNNRM